MITFSLLAAQNHPTEQKNSLNFGQNKANSHAINNYDTCRSC